jgi:hypothetical protein
MVKTEKTVSFPENIALKKTFGRKRDEVSG